MVKKLTLKNGFRILLIPQPSSVAATVLILVQAGSEYEIKRINGISHFLEHMVFKGTVNRPKPGIIAEELDRLGAHFNAFTSQEYTGYWAKVEQGKIGQALEIVADMYLYPLFDAKEIDKERGVIIEEINLYEDTPSRKVHDLFTSLLYGDQPAGWDIAGRKEVIRRLTRGDFLRYRSAHYVPSGTVAVVAGHFSVERVKEELTSSFGGVPPRRKQGKRATVERQKKPQVLVKFKESDQSHLVLGFRAFSILDKRRYALELLMDILGGGMSSRLWHRIREEMGAAYYVRADADLLLDHGFCGVAAGVDSTRIADVVRTTLEEIRRISKEPVKAEELQKTKDHLAGTTLLSLETSDRLAGFYGGQEIITGKFQSPEEMVARVRRVRAEELTSLARQIFKNNRLNLAVIGPHKKEAQFRKILKL